MGVIVRLLHPTPQQSGFVVLLDGARKTFVLLGIVVLQTDLEFNGFQKVTLLLLGLRENRVHSIIEGVTGNLRPK